MAALNSGSLNYLRTKSGGAWAWKPMLFDNPVDKISTMLAAMRRLGSVPECECFDTGIVRRWVRVSRVGSSRTTTTTRATHLTITALPCLSTWVC